MRRRQQIIRIAQWYNLSTNNVEVIRKKNIFCTARRTCSLLSVLAIPRKYCIATGLLSQRRIGAIMISGSIWRVSLTPNGQITVFRSRQVLSMFSLERPWKNMIICKNRNELPTVISNPPWKRCLPTRSDEMHQRCYMKQERCNKADQSHASIQPFNIQNKLKQLESGNQRAETAVP